MIQISNIWNEPEAITTDATDIKGTKRRLLYNATHTDKLDQTNRFLKNTNYHSATNVKQII